MLWNKLGKGITLQNLPWLSVLKEFKFLCPKGHRTKHNAFSRPTTALAPAPADAGPAPCDKSVQTAFKQRSNSG